MHTHFNNNTKFTFNELISNQHRDLSNERVTLHTPRDESSSQTSRRVSFLMKKSLNRRLQQSPSQYESAFTTSSYGDAPEHSSYRKSGKSLFPRGNKESDAGWCHRVGEARKLGAAFKGDTPLLDALLRFDGKAKNPFLSRGRVEKKVPVKRVAYQNFNFKRGEETGYSSCRFKWKEAPRVSKPGWVFPVEEEKEEYVPAFSFPPGGTSKRRERFPRRSFGGFCGEGPGEEVLLKRGERRARRIMVRLRPSQRVELTELVKAERYVEASQVGDPSDRGFWRDYLPLKTFRDRFLSIPLDLGGSSQHYHSLPKFRAEDIVFQGAITSRCPRRRLPPPPPLVRLPRRDTEEKQDVEEVVPPLGGFDIEIPQLPNPVPGAVPELQDPAAAPPANIPVPPAHVLPAAQPPPPLGPRPFDPHLDWRSRLIRVNVPRSRADWFPRRNDGSVEFVPTDLERRLYPYVFATHDLPGARVLSSGLEIFIYEDDEECPGLFDIPENPRSQAQLDYIAPPYSPFRKYQSERRMADIGFISVLHYMYKFSLEKLYLAGYDAAFQNISAHMPYPMVILMLQMLIAKDAKSHFLGMETLGFWMKSVHGDTTTVRLYTSICNFFFGVSIAEGIASMRGDPVERQGITDMLENWQTLAHAPLSVKVLGFLASLIPLLAGGENALFGTEFLGCVFRWLKKASPIADAMDLGISLVTYIMERLGVYEKTKDVKDIFGKTRLEEWLDVLDAFEAELISAKKNTKGVDLRGIEARGLEIYRAGLLLKDPNASTRAREFWEKMKKFSEGLKGSRIKPVAFILTGPVGIGKTIMIDKIHDCFRKRYGLSDAEVMMTWSETNFQAIPSIVGIVNINDTFQVKDEYNKIPMLALLQGLADSARFDAEGASLIDKNISLHPDIVLATTNMDKYYLSQATGGANKLDRRYKMIHFEWTPEFAAYAVEKNTKEYRLFEARDIPDGMNPVRYTIGYMENTDKKNIDLTIKTVLLETFNYFEVVGYILKCESERRLTSPVPPADPNGCQVCGLPLRSGCPCSVVEPQGNFVPPVRHVVSMDEEDATMVRDLAAEARGATLEAREVAREMLDEARTTRAGLLNLGNDALAKASEVAAAAAKKYALAAAAAEVAAMVAVALLILKGIKKMVELFRKDVVQEGQVLATSSFPLPPPEEKVERFHNTAASWLGAHGNSNVGAISRVGYKMFGIVVSPQIIAVPTHFFTSEPSLKEGDTFTFELRGEKYSIIYDRKARVASLKSGRDVSYLYAPGLKGVISSAYGNLPSEPSSPSELCHLGPYHDVKVSKNLTHEAPTKSGDCGLPLTGSVSGVVYGFHIGFLKVSGVRMTEPLYQSEVRWALGEFQKAGFQLELLGDKLPPVVEELVKQGKLAPGLHKFSDASWYDRTEVEAGRPPIDHHDHVPLGHVASQSTERFTAKKSTLFERFGDFCAPHGTPHAGKAKLVDGVYTSAVTLRLAAFGDSPVVDTRVLSEAVGFALDDLPQDCVLTPLSDYTALCGHLSNVLVNGRDESKSIGRTLQSLGITKDKAFSDPGDGVFVVHPRVLELIAEAERHLRSEEPIRPPFVEAVAKDEVYPTAKAEKGRKRFFYLGDWVDNHLMRRYLLPLTTYLLARPFQSNIVGTLNAASPAWKELHAYLSRHGPDVIDGDQETFDLRHKAFGQAYINLMVGLAKKLGYSVDDQRMVRRILLRAGRYVLCMEGNYYVCSSGLTSGRSDTIIFNSTVLKLLFYYAFIKLGGVGIPRNFLVLALTGDDSVVGVDPAIRGWFNGETLKELFLTLGYKMTAGDKTPKIEFKPLSEVSYLKRGFVIDGERVLAPLKLESIYRSLSYNVGFKEVGALMRERDLSASHSALREMVLHGEGAFRALREELLSEFPNEEYPEYDVLMWEYDSGNLETWRARQKVSLSYQPLEKEEWCPQSRGVKYSDLPARSREHVVYQGAQEASAPSPMFRRGVLEWNFPVSTPQRVNRDSSTVVKLFSTELNSTEGTVSTLGAPVTHITAINSDVEVAGSSMIYPSRPEHEVSIKEFLARPRQTSQWTTSTTGLALENLKFQWAVSAPIQYFLSSWDLFRGDPKVTISFTGSSSLIGLARVYFYPRFDPADTTYADRNRTLDALDFTPVSTSLLPHLDLDISTSCTCEIELPFIANQQYSSADWSIGFLMINPIKHVGGLTPDPVTITAYTSYHNVQVDRLVRQGGSEVSPRYLSQALGLASHLSSYFGAMTTPYTKMLALGAKAAYALGYSRAVEPLSSSVVSKKYGHFSYFSGEPSFVDVLGSDPLQSADVSRMWLPGPEEDSAYGIARKWSQIGVDVPLGTAYAVHPLVYQPVSGSVALQNYPHLGQAALMYERWSGDIDIKLQIVGSPLVRWRLGVQIVPEGATAPAFFVVNGSLLTHVVEIAGSTDYEFTVPYQGGEAFTNLSRGLFTSASTSNTRIMFFSISDPMGPSATPVYPCINVWIRAGSDFSLAIPSLALAQDFIVRQGGRDAFDASTYGEKVDSLRVLAKRKSRMFDVTNTSLTDYPIAFPADGFLPTGTLTYRFTTPTETTVTNQIFTFDSYIRSMFYGYKGGSCFSIVGRTEAPWLVGTDICPVGLPSVNRVRLLGRGGTIFMPEEQPILELVAPDKSGKAFKRSLLKYDESDKYESVVLNSLYYDETTPSPAWLVFQSAADDRSYVYHLGHLNLQLRV